MRLRLSIRLTVPAGLILFTLLLAGWSLKVNSRGAMERVEEQALYDLRLQMNRLQAEIENSLRRSDLPWIQEVIAELSANLQLVEAVLLDGDDMVIASADRVHIGQPAQSLSKHADPQSNALRTQLKDEVRDRRVGEVRITRDGISLIGVYPILLAAEEYRLRPKTQGLLCIDHDLSMLRLEAVVAVRKQTLDFVMGLCAFALALGVFFHLSVTRRIGTLVDATRRISEGDLVTRTPTGRYDELGILAVKFNEMMDRRRDLEEKGKQAEEELVQHHLQLEQLVDERTAALRVANKDLEDFAYSVSHDLKAPLRAITGFSEIISRRHRDSLNEESRRYFDHILTAGVHMNRLIEDILRFSRLGRQAVKAQPVPLVMVFSALENTFRDRVKELGGFLDIPDDLPTVWGDSTLLDQVFVNLIDNAFLYRRSDVAPRVEISWQTEGAWVVVSVKDNGIGIPAEYHEKAFNIFQRLHHDAEIPGTGVGLALVKRAATMLKGHVRLISAANEGSTFHVELPLSKEELQHEKTSPDFIS